MNVLLLLGRGIEGCGVTRFTIEIEQYLQKTGNCVKVLASSDKSWGRKTTQENDFVLHSFKSGAWSDDTEYDLCIITSTPPKNIDKDESISDLIYTNFLNTLKNLNTRIVYLQCDNKIHSINRNFYVDIKYMNTFFELLDRIVVHNINADFVKKFIHKYQLRRCGFTVAQQVLISTDFDEVASFIEDADKVDKTCWFIGRSAQWKGWREFRDFHSSLLMKNGYTSVLEGIELSINAKQDLCNIDENNHYTWRSDNLYEEGEIGAPVEAILDNIDDFRNKPILVYGPYNRIEALNRLHRAKFGMFFTYTGKEFGGQIEITFLEIVASGTVPVIRKELWETAFFNDVWLKDLGSPENLGIVVYDSSNPQKCLDLMNLLNDDEELYAKYLKNSLSFCKSQFNRDYIINRLIEKCLSDEDTKFDGEVIQISLW